MQASVHGSSDLAQAAEAAIQAAGGGAKLAKICGVTRFAVQQWKAKGIPPRHVGRICAATGLSPDALRPDLWGAAA